MNSQEIKIDLKNLPELLKINEAAFVLNVSPWTLRLWDNKGVLKAVRIGSRKDRRYKKEDILKILNQNTK